MELLSGLPAVRTCKSSELPAFQKLVAATEFEPITGPIWPFVFQGGNKQVQTLSGLLGGCRQRCNGSPACPDSSYFDRLPGVNSYGAPVPDEPTNSFRPSEKVISLPFALRDPSFAR